MHAVLCAEVDAIEPGCVSLLCGGYRRGKLESNDVDVVLTHPDATRLRGLCTRVTQRLVDKGA
jgi:DNA polymerase IV